MPDLVHIAQDRGVATLTLNRPDQANSLDLPLAQRLCAAVDDVSRDASVRCVLLTGAGKMFCGGGDVASFASAADRQQYVTELASTLHRAVLALLAMPKPLVVQVNGPAAGAGMSLALIGDVVLAATSAHFTAAYTRIGVTPDGGMTWLLPRLIGFRRAQDMIMTNRRVSALDAEQLGLVTHVVADDQLATESVTAARALASASTSALAVSRKLLWEGTATSLEAQLEREAHAIGEAAASRDGREGISAFLERRAPVFGEQGNAAR